MSLLDGIELFAITVETGSFAAAARRLGVTASAVSRRVANLEKELGVPLLSRTTRSLSLTHDGQSFHARCVRILDELSEAKDTLAHVRKRPSGTVRVDVPISMGRALIAPHIPSFLAKFPDVSVDLTLRDQIVDPFAEGLDVLVRVGPLRDSSLIARSLGESRLVVCGAPAYLRKRGTPKVPQDLARHDCIGYLRGGRPDPWRFRYGDSTYDIDITGHYNASDAGVILEAAIAGQGLAILFRFMAEEAIRKGALIALLDEHQPRGWPIHALYPKNRHLVPKVSVFLEFLDGLFGRTKRARQT